MRKGCSVFLLGNLQKMSGHGSGQLALGGPAWARWLNQVTSTVLWFCEKKVLYFFKENVQSHNSSNNPKIFFFVWNYLCEWHFWFMSCFILLVWIALLEINIPAFKRVVLFRKKKSVLIFIVKIWCHSLYFYYVQVLLCTTVHGTVRELIYYTLCRVMCACVLFPFSLS